MIELVYPLDFAPLAIGTSPGSSAEMLPVVESNGMVSAQASRTACHQRRLLHPVVRLFLINREGRFFLQKRAVTKELYPGLWDNAVTGHVLYGESFQEALFREASEEICLRRFNPLQIGGYIYKIPAERELVCVYAAVGTFSLNPNTDEVETGEYWSAEQIEKAVGKGVLTPGFEKDWRLFKDKVCALL
ncbi:MAG: NUDIX domain-containing protein [Bacteroidales bacterium]|nr:NUDIX domain-containing protein [Candidatus Cryptobacteroides fimicaballi]